MDNTNVEETTKMLYQPTDAQKQIMNQMHNYPETCEAIAARMPSNISRQNVSMQCRIMADNDVIKRYGRGRFSLKPEKEASFRDILRADPDYVRPTDVHRRL